VEKSTVYFAKSLNRARRLARPGENALFASPRSAAALTAALQRGLTVVAQPDPGAASWNRALRRFFLPGAPELLRAAISGVSGAPTEDPAGRISTPSRREPVRANWITERLTDRRARALLAEIPMPRLWILEDFRKLRVSNRVLARLASAGVRLAVYRPLRWKRARGRA
jgi:hypothetical protein